MQPDKQKTAHPNKASAGRLHTVLGGVVVLLLEY